MGEEVVHDRTLVALGEGGGRCDAAAIAACRGWLGRATDVVSLSFVGSMHAPVVARASPSTFAMVGDNVSAPPSRPEGGLLSRRPSSYIVQTVTAHRASTRNTQ